MLSDDELRELVDRELRHDIERRLREGASRDQVVESLVEEGFVAETARAYVEAVGGAGEPPLSRIRLAAMAACVVVAVAVLLAALLT